MKIRAAYVVTDAPKKHVEKFDRFIELVEGTLAEGEKFFFPRARGSRKKLIPPPRKNPCELCATARYNKLCPKARTCAPMLYFTMARVTNTSFKKFVSAKGN